MSDLFGNHIVGFPTRRLKCDIKQRPWLLIHAFNLPHYEFVRKAVDILGQLDTGEMDSKVETSNK